MDLIQWFQWCFDGGFNRKTRDKWWLNGDIMEISWTWNMQFFHRQWSRNGYYGDVKLPGGNMSAVSPSSLRFTGPSDTSDTS